MVAVIRRYEVLAGFADQFRRAYASEGDWAALLSKSNGFLGIQLLEGTDGSYLTIDQWRSESDLARFMCDHGLEYEALSRVTEGWTLHQALIGRFRAIVAPAAHNSENPDWMEKQIRTNTLASVDLASPWRA